MWMLSDLAATITSWEAKLFCLCIAIVKLQCGAAGLPLEAIIVLKPPATSIERKFSEYVRKFSVNFTQFLDKVCIISELFFEKKACSQKVFGCVLVENTVR